jgi:hypothetical protein
MRGHLIPILAAVHLGHVPSLFGWVRRPGYVVVSEADGFFISGMAAPISDLLPRCVRPTVG